MRGFSRKYASRFFALVVIAVLYSFARLPELPAATLGALASRFHFKKLPLPELPGHTTRSIREVNPSLKHISGWISSVGASVALNDLDGDGLPNDICYVDVRNNQVIVTPAPGTPARYKPFALDPAPLPYDPATMAPMGVLPGDFNEDGRTDILVYYWGRSPIVFLRRADSPIGNAVMLSRDRYVPVELVEPIQRWYTNAATQADLDGDGHVDIILGNYFPDGARILDAKATNQEQMQHSMSRAFNGGSKRFLLWAGATAGIDPKVKFKETDPGLPADAAHGWTLAIAAADLDGDLLPEVYFANDFGPDRLLHNRSIPGHLRFALLEGRKTLTTPSSKVLGRDSFKGMGVEFCDLEGKGLLDILVSNINAPFALEESNFAFMCTGELGEMRRGVAPYVDRSEPLGLSRSGWCWDVRTGDFHNDGVLEVLQATGFVKGNVNRWPELHEIAMGNDELLSDPRSWHNFEEGDDISGRQHTRFYVRAQDGRYYDVAGEIGMGEPHVSRGIATADVDGDGRLDFAIANQWEQSNFYRNVSPNPGEFLGLHLLLPLQPRDTPRTVERAGHAGHDLVGRPAIGATAIVTLSNGRRIASQVDGGNGHSGKRSPDLHFGLGQISHDSRLPVQVRWRDPGGRVHDETIRLAPGWHTIMLGWTP